MLGNFLEEKICRLDQINNTHIDELALKYWFEQPAGLRMHRLGDAIVAKMCRIKIIHVLMRLDLLMAPNVSMIHVIGFFAQCQLN